MKSPIDELVGNDEVGRLVLFFQRAHRGDRDDPLHAELLECIDVGAEIQLRRQNAMSASMPCQKGNLAAFQFAEHERVRWIAKWRFHALFMNIGESGHGVKPAAADDPDLCLSQCSLSLHPYALRPAGWFQQTFKYKGRKRR